LTDDIESRSVYVTKQPNLSLNINIKTAMLSLHAPGISLHVFPER